MKVTCGNCGASLTAPDDAGGTTVRCPKCKQAFELQVLELTEDAGAASPVNPTSPLDQLAQATERPHLTDPVRQPQARTQAQTPVLMTPQRRCVRCGFQGYMPKKWESWVIPVAIIVALLTCGLGLLILFVPKKYKCPQCGAGFD